MKWLGPPSSPVRATLRQGDCEGAAPMTAVEARTAWLERELMAMKRVMEREASLQQRLRTVLEATGAV